VPAPVGAEVAESLRGRRGIVRSALMEASASSPGPGSEIVLTNGHHHVELMASSLDASTLATKGNEQARIRRLPRLEPIAELPRAKHV